MDGKSVPDRIDWVIAALAGEQHGVVAIWQLLLRGFADDAVHHRVQQGRLHRLHFGVYAVGHTKLSVRGRWMGAVLACGPDAALSHRDGGALWRIRRDSRFLIDVTAPGRSRHARPGIAIHRPRRFEPDECTTVDGIPVTTVARTLIDLAAVVPYSQLVRAWDEAVRLRVFDFDDLVRVRSRFKARGGLRHVDLLIAEARPLPPMTRSELEVLALELFRAAGFPEPAVNVYLPEARAEVDFLFRDQRVVVEVDGGAYHRTDRQRDEDNARDARLQLARYTVIRVSDRRLNHDPEGVIADVAAALVRGGGRRGA